MSGYPFTAVGLPHKQTVLTLTTDHINGLIPIVPANPKRIDLVFGGCQVDISVALISNSPSGMKYASTFRDSDGQGACHVGELYLVPGQDILIGTKLTIWEADGSLADNIPPNAIKNDQGGYVRNSSGGYILTRDSEDDDTYNLTHAQVYTQDTEILENWFRVRTGPTTPIGQVIEGEYTVTNQTEADLLTGARVKGKVILNAQVDLHDFEIEAADASDTQPIILLEVKAAAQGSHIHHFKIDGLNTLNSFGIDGDGWTTDLLVEYGEITRTGADAFRTFKNSVFQYMYAHSFRSWNEEVDGPYDGSGSQNLYPHTDGAQFLRDGSTVRYSWVYNTNAANGTSAVIIIPTLEPITNVVIDKNYLNGGGYIVHIHPVGTLENPGPYGYAQVTITNNRFGRDYRLGTWSSSDTPTSYITHSGNVWADDGTPIPPPPNVEVPNSGPVEPVGAYSDHFGDRVVLSVNALNEESIVKDSSNRVSEIVSTDGVGGRKFSQTLNVRKPVYSSNAIAGYPAFTLDGNQGMEMYEVSGIPYGNAAMTIAAVVSGSETLSGFLYFVGFGDATVVRSKRMGTSSGTLRGETQATLTLQGGNVMLGDWHSIVFVVQEAVDGVHACSLSIDGGPASTANLTANAVEVMRVTFGCAPASNGTIANYWVGAIQRLHVLNSALTDDEVSWCHATHLWDIEQQARLPEGHLYKTQNPSAVTMTYSALADTTSNRLVDQSGNVLVANVITDPSIPLKELAKSKGITFGTSIQAPELMNASGPAGYETRMDWISDNVDLFVPGYTMMPDNFNTALGVFNTNAATAFIADARSRGKAWRGHCAYYPKRDIGTWAEGYLQDNPSQWQALQHARIEALANIPNADTATNFDVINEVFSPGSANPGGWRTSPWTTAAGSFTAPAVSAFQKMREVMPNMPLYWCQDASEQLGSSTFLTHANNILTGIEACMDLGAPVDGYAMQAHLTYRLGFDAQSAVRLRDFCRNLTEGLGLKLIVSELDSRTGYGDGILDAYGNVDTPPPSAFSSTGTYDVQGADLVKRFLDTVLPFVTASGGNQLVSWTLDDGYNSWTEAYGQPVGERPAPYTNTFQPKPQLTAIRNALLEI